MKLAKRFEGARNSRWSVLAGAEPGERAFHCPCFKLRAWPLAWLLSLRGSGAERYVNFTLRESGDGMALQAFVLSGSGHSGYGRGFSTSIAFATSTLSFKKRELRWEIIFGRLITIFAIMFCLDGLACSSPARSPIRSMKSCCSACLRYGRGLRRLRTSPVWRKEA
jgi:hypothetical protein